MRQLSFLFIFIVLLILVLFAMKNTDPATIVLYDDIKFEAPIAIELILAMGVGAFFAWIFAVWSGIQQSISMSSKEKQIKALQKKVEELSIQAEKQQLMLESAIDVEVEEKAKN